MTGGIDENGKLMRSGQQWQWLTLDEYEKKFGRKYDGI